MLDALRDALAALLREGGELPAGVRIWMRFMVAVFLTGLLFAPWRAQARWIVTTMLLTAASLIAVKAWQPGWSRTTIGTLVQLTLWIPLLGLLVRDRFRRSGVVSASGAAQFAFLAWLYLAMAVIAISTVLNLWQLAKW